MEPWTKDTNAAWSVASQTGQALYWQWHKENCDNLPENFVIFLRTVFPNGGHFAQVHCSHSVIWSCLEDDLYGVGIRRNKSGPSWIVAVLAKSEAYPGSSSSPDRELSLKSHRFLAEEFLRGTDPLDIYKCKAHICRDSTDWWNYLEKLEKVVNWKLPEVKLFKAAATTVPSPKQQQSRWEPRTSTRSTFTRKTSLDNQPFEETVHSALEAPKNHTTSSYRVPRSRSPTERTRPISGPSVPGPEAAAVAPRKPAKIIQCNRCNIQFEQSYELMRHYSSLEHQETVAKEYPI